MPTVCAFCGSRKNLTLRREISCAADPPAQSDKGGPRRKGLWICDGPECLGRMLPIALPAVFAEWCEFHSTRRQVTTMRNAGMATKEALEVIMDMESPSSGINQLIAQGLHSIYGSNGSRQIYDPEFQDPAYFTAVSAITLVKDDPPVLWFMLWSLLMRFNRKFNASLLPLWRADSRKVFDNIMEKASMASITTRGNESGSVVQGRVWDLKLFFKKVQGQTLARLASEKLVDGVPFQEVVESFALPEDLRPYGFKHASKDFKPYFIGKVLATVSPRFTHKELVGGSLIAMSRKDAEDSMSRRFA
jgi:hypothetical protein